jgi:hypothetical protein
VALKSGRTFVSLVLMVPLFQTLFPHPAFGGRIIGTLAVGLDSFSEKYSVVDSDTSDTLTEFRTRLNIGFLQGNLSGSYLQVDGQSLVGQESLETMGRVSLTHRPGTSRFSLVGDVTYRTYRENTTYSFPNDFVRYHARAYVQRSLSESFRLRVTGRTEWVDYDRHTEFDQDHLRQSLEMSAEVDRSFTNSYRVAMGFTRKSIPDSSAISYQAFTGTFEYRLSLGLRRPVLGAILDADDRAADDWALWGGVREYS